jgi:hypothetical protein
MNIQAHSFLAKEMVQVRILADLSPSPQTLQNALARVSVSLEAFQATGLVTNDEAKEWLDKIRNTLSIPPQNSLFADRDLESNSLKTSLFAGEPREPVPAKVTKMSRVTPSFTTVDICGGRLDVHSRRTGARTLAINCMLEPLPNVEELYPEQMTALRNDLAGIPESQSQSIVSWATARHMSSSLQRPALSDGYRGTYELIKTTGTGGTDFLLSESLFHGSSPAAKHVFLSWANKALGSVPILVL